MASGGRRRFEFGWLEVFGLILVFAGGSAVVFFLGVFVGKGLQESRLAREERVVRLSVDGLGGGSRSGSAAAPSATVDLSALATPTPTAAPATPTPDPAVAAAVARIAEGLRPQVAQTVAPQQPGAPRAPVVAPTAARARPQPTRVAEPRPRPTQPTSVAAAQRPGNRRGGWSVQVNATKDAQTAQRLIQQLRQRGYDAYDVRVVVSGQTWHRVRVGKFNTMQEATATVARLRDRERYSRAFLVEE